MSKNANAGELRTAIYFKRIERATDSEGYPTEREVNVFGEGKYALGKWVNAHGSEVFDAMQLELREPATLTVRYSPLINETLLVYMGAELASALRAGDGITDAEAAEKAVNEALEQIRYEIISMDNVEGRNTWLEIKVQRKVAAR